MRPGPPTRLANTLARLRREARSHEVKDPVWRGWLRDIAALLVATTAIGSLVATGMSVSTQNREAQIERTPVIYVECTVASELRQSPDAGTIYGIAFNMPDVFRAFPKMKPPNGQAIAIFSSLMVEACRVHNYGKLPVVGLRLPIVARLLTSTSTTITCDSVGCGPDYGKVAELQRIASIPEGPLIEAMTIEPGGSRSFQVQNLYRQWLEFEFLPQAKMVVPPDATPTTAPVVVGGSRYYLLAGGTDCPPPGFPKGSSPTVNGKSICP